MATFQVLKPGAFIAGDKWSLTRGEKTRQSLIADAFRIIDLGGTREGGVDGNGAQNADEYKDRTFDGANLQGFTAQVRFEVRTDSAGTSVTPYIRDVTNIFPQPDLATGSTSTSLTWFEQVVSITLPPAARKYRFILFKSNGEASVYGVAAIEILAP